MDSASSFLPGIKIQGAGRNQFLCKLLVFSRTKFQEEWAKVSEGAALWKKGRLETVLCDYQIVRITDCHLKWEFVIIFMTGFQQE